MPLGFFVSDQRHSSLGLPSVRTAPAKEGLGGRRVDADETVFELTYGIQATPAIRHTPQSPGVDRQVITGDAAGRQVRPFAIRPGAC